MLRNAKEIFLEAMEIADPAKRQQFVNTQCAVDAELLVRVQELLEAAEQPGGVLDQSLKTFLPTDLWPQISENVGEVIGHYKLLERIGEGGCGVVFMAEQQQPVRRKVALKVIKPGMDTRQVLARFEAERQALALMDHPNIARVFDAGATASGRPYFVMELVQGVSITQFCDEHQLSVPERLELFVSVCHAAQHAHQKGIIHRDIKPSNVLVTLHDDRPVVKVIDFGLAKATSGSLTDKTLFTNFLQIVGTPLYMSPEQAAVSGIDIDTRSDIYSLGVLLYELLTGTTPFSREHLQGVLLDELRRIIREEEPAKPSTRLTSLKDSWPTLAVLRKTEPRKLGKLMQGDLDWIVMKAMDKDRSRRYATASEFAHDVLNHLTDQPVMAGPPSMHYVLWKFARRNWHGVLISLIIVAALLVTTIVSAGFGRWALLEKVEAQTQRRESQRIANLEKLERIRLTERYAGWSHACKTLLNDAGQSHHPEHRNYAASILQGTDLELQRHWTGFDAGTVRFQSDLKGVLVGGHLSSHPHSSAMFWTDIEAAPLVSTVAANGPALFINGKACQVRFSEQELKRTIELVDIDHGNLVRFFAIPDEVVEPVQLVAVAEQARYIACAFGTEQKRDVPERSTVIAWDGESGKMLFRQSIESPSALTFSPTDSLLAIGTEGGFVTAIDLSTREQRAEIRQGSLPIRSLAFCCNFRRSLRTPMPDSQVAGWFLAVGTAGGRISVWDVNNVVLLNSVSGGNYNVHALAFHPNGTLLASAGRTETRLWDVARGTPVLRLNVSRLGDMSRNYQLGVDFSRDGSRLAVACKEAFDSPGGVDIWKFPDKQPIRSLRGLAGQIEKIVFSPSGKYVGALTQDWELGVWETVTGKLISVFEVPRGLFADNAHFTFDQAERRLAYSTFQRALICDLETKAVVVDWELPPGLVNLLSYVDASTLYLMRMETQKPGLFPDSRTPSREYPRVTRIRNLLSPTPLDALIEIKEHNITVVDACVAGQGDVFVIYGLKSNEGRTAKSIIAVDARTNQQLWSRSVSHPAGGTVMFADVYGATVAIPIADYDSRVMVDARANTEQGTLPMMPNAGFTPGASLWATWSVSNPGLKIFEGPAAKEPVITLARDDIVRAGATFSARGTTLIAWGNSQGEVSLCDLPQLLEKIEPIDRP